MCSKEKFICSGEKVSQSGCNFQCISNVTGEADEDRENVITKTISCIDCKKITETQ